MDLGEEPEGTWFWIGAGEQAESGEDRETKSPIYSSLVGEAGDREMQSILQTLI